MNIETSSTEGPSSIWASTGCSVMSVKPASDSTDRSVAPSLDSHDAASAERGSSSWMSC